MNNRYAILVATSIFAISSTSAQVNAATKSKQQLNLKVATVHAGDQKLSGTATKGTKIKVTRYAKTYGTGKVSAKSGKFTFKLNQPVKANWHYRVTVTKKGYKPKVVHFGPVKKAGQSTDQSKHDVDVAKLQLQINDLKALVNQIGEQQPQTLISYTNDGETTDLKHQIVDLNNQIKNLKNKLSDSESDITDKMSNLRDQINELQSQIANIESNLTDNSYSSVDLNNNSGSEISKVTQPDVDQDYESRKTESDRIDQELSGLDSKIQVLEDEKTKKDWIKDHVVYNPSKQVQENLDYCVSQLELLKQDVSADPQNQNLQFKVKNMQSQVDNFAQILADSIKAEESIAGHEMEFSDQLDQISIELNSLYSQRRALSEKRDSIWCY